MIKEGNSLHGLSVYFKIFLATILLVTTIPINHIVLADDTVVPVVPVEPTSEPSLVSAGAEANGNARSMLEYFKADRGIDVNAVTQDEMKVYGVFMSNFFKPFSTTVKDISAKESISLQFSEKFFGSKEKENEVMEINTKISDAIIKGLTETPKEWGLYANKDQIAKDSLMHGKTFLTKLVADESYKVVNFKGEDVFNMRDKHTLGAFKMVMGFAPTMFLGMDKGLSKIDQTYLDGFGNVWGRPTGETNPSNYVLILPAVLNVNLHEGKLPLNNTFAFGALLNINTSKVEKLNILRPYYNVFEVQKSKGITSIVGIQSASDFIGATNKIVKEGNTSKAKTGSLDISDDTKPDATKGKTRIMLSFDLSGNVDTINNLKKLGLSDADEQELIAMLSKSLIFTKAEISETMYFFDTNYTAHAGDASAGDFNNSESLMMEFNIFDYKDDKTGDSKFYVNSYSTSDFNKMMNRVAQGEKLETILKGETEYTDKDKETQAFIKFVSGTPPDNYNDVIDYIKSYLKEDGYVPSLGIAAPANYSFRAKLKDKWFSFSNRQAGAALMTPSDTTLMVLSEYAANRDYWTSVAPSYNDKVVQPFSTLITPFNVGNAKVSSAKEKKIIDELFYTLYSYRMFTTNKAFLDGVDANLTASGSSFSSTLGNFKSGTAVADVTGNFAGLYWAYLRDLMTVTVDSAGSVTGSAFNGKYLPNMTIAVEGTQFGVTSLFGAGQTSSSAADGGGISGNLNADETGMGAITEVLNTVKKLISGEINDEKMNVVESMVDSFSIATHNGMTGSWSDSKNTLSGSTGNSYKQTYDYIKAPSLSELPLVNIFLDSYFYLYLTVMFFILTFFAITALFGIYSITQSIIMFGLMAFMLLIPQYFVGTVATVPNSYGERAMSERFVFWAMAEHQTSSNGLATAETMDKEQKEIDSATAEPPVEGETPIPTEGVEQPETQDDKINSIIESAMQTEKVMNGGGNGNASPSGVTLKWLAPKRVDYFNQIFTSDEDKNLINNNGSMFKWIFSSYFYKEEFVHNDNLATYLYRPYSAITADASANYNNLMQNESNASKAALKKNIQKYIVADALFSEEDYKLIMTNATAIQADDKVTQGRLNAALPPYSGETFEEGVKYRYWGIANEDVTKAIMRTDYEIESAGLTIPETDEDFLAFSFLTESPYYYFYNVLKYRYSSGTDAGSDFKSTLLKENIFKVTEMTNDGLQGHLKDFLDLEGLFTYVIPYLKKSNDYVDGWTGKYGDEVSTFDFGNGQITDGVVSTLDEADNKDAITAKDIQKNKDTVPTEETIDAQAEIAGALTGETVATLSEQYQYESSKKEALGNVWKMYSPWVDQLYNQYHDVTLKVRMYDQAVVTDVLNPAHYYLAGRDMVFSPAEAKASYVGYSQMSETEEKLLKVLEDTYIDLMYLNNYRNFSEESLLSMAAMLATFNFNKEFSQVNFFGESSVLYPQAFELKNFNYDAYMRMAMLNATNESLEGDKDLYVRIMEKTSFITGVLLNVKNFFGIYVVPWVRVVTLVLMFFLTLAYVCILVLTPPMQILLRTWSTLLKPAVLYMLYTAGFAELVTWFLGEGETGYVGAKSQSFGLSDPTSALFGMLFLDIVYVVLLTLLALNLFKKIRENVRMLFALVKNIASQIVDRIKATVSSVQAGDVNSGGNIHSDKGVTADKAEMQGVFRKGLGKLGNVYRKGSVYRENKERKKVQKMQGQLYSDWLSEASDPSVREQKIREEERIRGEERNSLNGEEQHNAITSATNPQPEGKVGRMRTNFKKALTTGDLFQDGSVPSFKGLAKHMVKATFKGGVESTQQAATMSAASAQDGAKSFAGGLVQKFKTPAQARERDAKVTNQLRQFTKASESNLSALRNQNATQTKKTAGETSRATSIGVRVALEKARKKRNRKRNKRK